MTVQDKDVGAWTCPNCGEQLDATFDLCWSCGTQRDGAVSDDFDKAVEVAPITHCRQCGYPLRGLISPRCPECGAFTDVIDTKDTESPLDHWFGWTQLRWLCAAALAWFAFAVAISVVGHYHNGMKDAPDAVHLLSVAAFASAVVLTGAFVTSLLVRKK